FLDAQPSSTSTRGLSPPRAKAPAVSPRRKWQNVVRNFRVGTQRIACQIKPSRIAVVCRISPRLMIALRFLRIVEYHFCELGLADVGPRPGNEGKLGDSTRRHMGDLARKTMS